VLPVAAILALLVGTGIGASAKQKAKTLTVLGPTTTATVQAPTVTETQTVTVTTTPIKVIATHTATVRVIYTPPPPKQFSDGTYVVGTEIKPGTYHAAATGSFCSWARLSDLSGSGVIDLGNTSGGPLTVTIEPSDKAFLVQGGCTFGRVG